jgi:hypothetical protein
MFTGMPLIAADDRCRRSLPAVEMTAGDGRDDSGRDGRDDSEGMVAMTEEGMVEMTAAATGDFFRSR